MRQRSLLAHGGSNSGVAIIRPWRGLSTVVVTEPANLTIVLYAGNQVLARCETRRAYSLLHEARDHPTLRAAPHRCAETHQGTRCRVERRRSFRIDREDARGR